MLHAPRTNQSSDRQAARVAFLVRLLGLVALMANASATEDNEHAQALKDFVPDHPHLHELIDKTHQGDVDAKHKFERESLSVRFNKTKSQLPADTDEEHIVLHFLDDYTAHVSGDPSDHKFMALDPFISLLTKEDDLKKRLVELGKLLEKAECDFTCLGQHLTDFMNDTLDRMMRTEL